MEIVNILDVNNSTARIDSEGNLEIHIRELAIGCGLVKTQTKEGKEYISIRWTRVSEYLEDIDLSHKWVKNVDGELGLISKDFYLPEKYIYRFIFKCESESAKKFQDWVFDILLPTLRKEGCVILDHATDETIEFAKRYGTAKRIKNTFLETKNVTEEYEAFKLLADEKVAKNHFNNDFRVRLQNHIITALQERLAAYSIASWAKHKHQILYIQDLIETVLYDIDEGNNRSYGRKIGEKTKKIKELQNKIAEIQSEIDNGC